MKKTVIKIPEGVTYLSDWEDFKNILPNEHFILNKKICGCGATEAFLRNDDMVILASPRKHLLYNKYFQHKDDNMFLYRYDGNLEKYTEYKEESDSKSKSKKYINALKKYLKQGGKKILVTYDSLPTVTSVIVQELGDCRKWTVVIDEFQSMFCDSFYKAVVEETLNDILKFYDRAIYLSATPFLEKYLDDVKTFKNIPMVELEWPEDIIDKSEVITKKLNKSISDKCLEIVDKYRKGLGYYEIINDKMVTAREAVFYLNNVTEICRIITKCELKDNEVNIICSDTPKNRRAIKRLGKRTKQKFCIGVIPEKGEPHKMFTFCTSTVYIGADFYSTSSYAYVFANPYVESMAIDVSVDFQQILGRERLKENPFRGKATLFYALNGKYQTDEEAQELFKRKIEETEARIENFNCVPNKKVLAFDLEETVKSIGHVFHYACIRKDKDGNPIDIISSDILRVADIRAWEIINRIYNNDFNVYSVLSSTMSVRREVDSDNPKVQKMMDDWLLDNDFSRKAKLFCSWYKECPNLLDECNFIEHKFRNYFAMIGEKGFESTGWKESTIKNDIRKCLEDNQFIRKKNISSRVYKELVSLLRPTKPDIKNVIGKIYRDESINTTPKAIDVEKYVTCKRASYLLPDGKRNDTLDIVSPYRKMVSVFPNIKAPDIMENKNIDMILKEIRDEKYKNEIEKIRRGEGSKLSLPGVCYNGTFTRRCKSGIDIYSSFTTLDIDDIKGNDRMKEIKRFLTTIPYVYSYFISPSGNGLKVIVLHDNINWIDHDELYSQILGEFSNIPELDKCTRDLARCNFISSDPSLYLNPSPRPYHFIPSQDKPLEKKESYYIGGNCTIVKDDDKTTAFLNKLHSSLVSDEEILRILKKRWNNTVEEGERNNKALAYSSVLCRAGIEINEAFRFVSSLIPGFDCKERVEYAYKHNFFGSDRIKFVHKK